jgi:hypothetical protein
MAVVQQAIGKVRTKKSGSAGNENMHGQILALQKQWLVTSVSASVSASSVISPTLTLALAQLPSSLVPSVPWSL